MLPAPGASGGGATGLPPGDGSRTSLAETNPLTVHAAGAVAHPGVYGVRQGARVTDVLAAAGGPSAEADLDQLNLAAPVADGERVRVPRRGEVADGPDPSSGAGAGTQPAAAGSAARPAAAVDINRAGAQELESLPGVGPATAAAIVAWRQAHGRFRSVTDLLEVRGIGPAKFETLRPLVRV